jgi:hypothetical protein
MAMTEDRATPERDGELLSDPLAAGALIYAGRLYGLDADGNAVPIGPAAVGRVRAVARARAEQSAGDTRVEGARGVFCFDNVDGITRANIGQRAYAADGQRVAADGSHPIGEIVDVQDAGVWVRVGWKDLSREGDIPPPFLWP